MVKPKRVKAEDVVARNDLRRGLRSQSNNRNDGDGRYDLRPLATIRHRRRWRLRRQDAKSFLSETKSAAIKASRRRLLAERRRGTSEQQQPREDDVTSTSLSLASLTAIDDVPSTLRATCFSTNQLQTIGGGDGDGLNNVDASTCHITSPMTIAMTRVQRNVESSATGLPGDTRLSVIGGHYRPNDSQTVSCVNVPTYHSLIEDDGSGNGPPEH